MVEIFLEHTLEVAELKNEEPVTAHSSDGANDPFAYGVRTRGAKGREDRLDAFGTPHGVEGGRELAVAVANEELKPAEAVGQFPGPLTDPRWVGWVVMPPR